MEKLGQPLSCVNIPLLTFPPWCSFDWKWSSEALPGVTQGQTVGLGTGF